MMPYPENPIATMLRAIYEAQERKRQRQEYDAEKKRREELYQLQLGQARRESQQAEEQTRVDAMTAGQFAAAQGLRVTPGLEGKTIGELRRAQLLATAFERVDPRAEARERISGSEMLAKTFGIKSPIYGEDIRAATGYQGPLPNVPARPMMSPAPGQGVASVPLEEGVMLEPPKAPTKRVVFVNPQGNVVQTLELPEGTDVRTLTPPTPKDPARFVITDHKGNIVKTFEAPPGTQLRTLPAPSSGGTNMIGPSMPQTGGVDVRPVKDKKGLVVAYSIDGKRYSVAAAQALAERMLANGDPRGRALAHALDGSIAMPFANNIQKAEEDLVEAQATGDPQAADRARVRLAYWQNQQDKRLGRTRPRYGFPPTVRTEEQRPASGQQQVATLPPASSVAVGTEAVDNRTGKRYRSDGRAWVEVR